MTDENPIAFIDLAAQQARLRTRIDAAIASVLDSGAYIMGPDVRRLERELSEFCGAKHSIGCANGTDAIQLALMALEIGPGDAVFVPSFTFAATAEVVALVGATPVFIDSLPDTFNMDPASLERTIAAISEANLRPRAVIPVDLFGLPANMPAIGELATRHNLDAICDSAQGFGGTIGGRMTGTFGRLSTTSFFPAKPLGCYGDGGAVFTDDDDLAAVIHSLQVHGKGNDKYDNVRVGLNSRLDTLQAAILSVKLSVYEEEITARNRVAERYRAHLSNRVTTPLVPEGYTSVWAQYTVTMENETIRSQMQQALAARQIPTAVYYPKPLHEQTAYRNAPRDPQGLATCESLARRVLSLPMHPDLDAATQDRIISGFNGACAEVSRN